MRILHLMNGLEIGGREGVVLQLCEDARRDGWESELILFDTPFRSEEQDFDPGALTVHFLPRRPGIDWGYVRRLAGLLRERRPCILHAHNDTAVFYGSLASLWAGGRGRRRVPTIGTFHTLPAATSRRARAATRWAGATASRLTAVSSELASRLRNEGWARRVETIWNGVDLERFQPRRSAAERVGPWRGRLGLGPQDWLVGNVGRFERVKRQQDLIEAHRALRATDERFHLVLVGQGGELQAARAQASGVEGITFVESTGDVAGLLRELDVFVLCSEHECAPCVLLEAMSAGLACVATDVGGIPELLDSNRAEPAGVIVPPATPAALSGAILSITRDAELRAELGARARLRASDFSSDRCWQQYSQAYRAAAGRHEPADE